MKSFDKESFIYELLLAYGLSKASITRLQKGNFNLSKNEGEIISQKKLSFKVEYKADLHITSFSILSCAAPCIGFSVFNSQPDQFVPEWVRSFVQNIHKEILALKAYPGF